MHKMECPAQKKRYVLSWDFDISAQDGYLHTRSFPISLGDEKEFSKIKKQGIPIVILPENHMDKAIVAISRKKYPGEMNSIIEKSINDKILQETKKNHLFLAEKKIIGFSYLYRNILKVVKISKGKKFCVRKGVKIQLYSTEEPYTYILEIIDKGLNEWRNYREGEVTGLVLKKKADEEEQKIVNSLMKLSQDEILKRIKTKPQKPQKRRFYSEKFLRDPLVVVFVIKRSKGFCELCEDEAPFLKDDDLYYLEAHHVKPLSKGGDDTPNNVVALCPNCHRLLHHGRERHKKRKFLSKKFKIKT